LEIILYVLKNFLLIAIEVLDIAMLVRAIFSWIDPMAEGRLLSFLILITEPIILPFRKLCEKKNWFVGSPLDVPFFMAILALFLVRFLLLMI